MANQKLLAHNSGNNPTPQTVRVPEIPPTQRLCEKPIEPALHRPRVGGGAIAKLNPRENGQPSTDPASVEATTGSYATAATRQRRTVAHPRHKVEESRRSREGLAGQSLPPPTQGRWRAGGSREG